MMLCSVFSTILNLYGALGTFMSGLPDHVFSPSDARITWRTGQRPSIPQSSILPASLTENPANL
jgi:hypothetical protein